jgi:hypothetical protein
MPSLRRGEGLFAYCGLVLHYPAYPFLRERLDASFTVKICYKSV